MGDRSGVPALHSHALLCYAGVVARRQFCPPDRRHVPLLSPRGDPVAAARSWPAEIDSHSRDGRPA